MSVKHVICSYFEAHFSPMDNSDVDKICKFSLDDTEEFTFLGNICCSASSSNINVLLYMFRFSIVEIDFCSYNVEESPDFVLNYDH